MACLRSILVLYASNYFGNLEYTILSIPAQYMGVFLAQPLLKQPMSSPAVDQPVHPPTTSDTTSTGSKKALAEAYSHTLTQLNT
jgi:hypothetical protein